VGSDVMNELSMRVHRTLARVTEEHRFLDSLMFSSVQLIAVRQLYKNTAKAGYTKISFKITQN